MLIRKADDGLHFLDRGWGNRGAGGPLLLRPRRIGIGIGIAVGVARHDPVLADNPGHGLHRRIELLRADARRCDEFHALPLLLIL